MSDSLRQFAQWASATQFADIPAEVVEAAKSQAFSALAAVHAGYRSDLGAPIRTAFGSPAGIGSHAMPAGIVTSPSHAAFLMASWAVVLDFGINYDENDKLVGDVDWESALPIVSAISPTPGGTGPMTTIALLANTIKAARRLTSNL